MKERVLLGIIVTGFVLTVAGMLIELGDGWAAVWAGLFLVVAALVVDRHS